MNAVKEELIRLADLARRAGNPAAAVKAFKRGAELAARAEDVLANERIKETLRDKFAAAALTGILARGESADTDAAALAIWHADDINGRRFLAWGPSPDARQRKAGVPL